MININYKWSIQKLIVLSIFSLCLIATSCSNDDSGPEEQEKKESVEGREKFTLALSASPTGETKVYTQTLTDVSDAVTVSYDGKGFEMPSTRTARIFASANGKSLFNLDYGGGRIYKFSVDGGETYSLKHEKNVEFAIGTAYPRWTKASEASASIHYADGRNATRVFDENDPTKFIRSDVKLRIMSVGLDNLAFGSIEEITIPVSDTDLKPYTMNIDGTDYDIYNYVGRVDAPVIAGNKIYYGISKSAYNPANPCSGRGCPRAIYSNVETLVLDYPSLTNPQIISTDIAKGATNGYRTPVSYVDESNDVYQIISVPNKDYDTKILKISNGAYDDNYDFNISNLLGFNVATNGWFYAGNGIGYVPYANTDESDNWFSDSVWGVARVDLYNKTVVDLNVPDNLWLTQYQSAVVKDGKFYMAITPTGADGNIYIFDTTSTDPNGYEVGAKLINLAEGTYIGIY
ncbi:hypothetical protein A8C32_12765 [Flavivirga aquatica]|uniref:DUF4374 domain-containing protein n=1 Tax=Flavivirga aquatica TaxID=1849968 RepID=A0A1E5TE00_9FLAO|nr:hypothetical protein [Flavivirga aquatica]OEK09569.1 hypothetical protein A8C32_12765 [Flavivirga aquatica]